MIAFKLPFEDTGVGCIGDQVFHDRDTNGAKDRIEAGIPTGLVSFYKFTGQPSPSPVQLNSFLQQESSIA